ncbi:MAG: hypothetical protein U0166_28335 [Acidobacteriota bacterium]
MDVAPVAPPDELARSAFARYGFFQSFAACGAAATAIVNPRLCDDRGAPLGQVGYLACPDDLETASALLDTVEGWLRARGCRSVLGPMNGGAHRPHRVLMTGFDRAPFVAEPRNPAHVPRLLERRGYRVLREWSSFELPLSDLRALLDHRGFHRAADRAARRYRIDPLPAHDLGSCVERLHPLLDRVWAGHVGYASIDRDELAEALGPVLSLMSDRTIGLVAEKDGPDVGTAFMLRDPARPTTMVLHTLAFVPGARRHGAPFLIVDRGFDLLERDGITDVIVALVADDFPLFGRIAAPTRSYALYGKALTRS